MEILHILNEYHKYCDTTDLGLNEFQWQLLQQWFRAKAVKCGRDKKVPPVIRKFQQWLYLKFGRQSYMTFAGLDCLCFSHVDTVRGHIRDDRSSGQLMSKYQLGINDHIIQKVAPRRLKNNWAAACGDGTRGKRALKRLGTDLVGAQFHPDVARWDESKYKVPRTKAALVEIISIIRRLNLLSAELHTEQLRNVTERNSEPSLTVAIIPEAGKGNTGFSTLLYWLQLAAAVRKAFVQLKTFVTDNCSTGLSGGQLLMTATEEMLQLGCSYLGLPCDDSPFFDVYCQPASVWVGYGYACKWVPLPLSWESDNSHLIRLGRNLLNNLSFCVFFCIQQGSLRGAKVASFDKLREMAQNRLAPGMGLKEIVTISTYAEFKNDAAYRLCSMDVIDLLKTHHPEDAATILALESLHFNAEAHRNPNFSNPVLMVEYVWRAAAVWEMQENYIKKVAKVARPSDCLPSHQFRKAMVMSACTATNYALCYFLEGRDFEVFNLAELNQDELEGLHSCGRHMTGKRGGANDANFTAADWVEGQDNMQAMADCKRYCEEEGGVVFGAPRHTENTHKRNFNLGQYGDDTDFKKSHRYYKPRDSFADFVEDLIMARESAYAWARARYEELFGPAYVDQCRDEDEWEERQKVPSRDKWLTCKRVRTGHYIDEAANDPVVAAQLRKRNVVDLPCNMRLVHQGREDITTPSECLCGKVVVPEKVKANYEKLERELLEEAQKQQDDVAMDCMDVETCDDVSADETANLIERLEALQAEADAFQKANKETRLADKQWIKNIKVASEDDHAQLALVLAGSVVLNEDDGTYESVDQILSKYQRQDRVARDRCRRFIKYVLHDWKAALKEGHDVTLGTCFVIEWGGHKTFAVVRVLKMYDDGNSPVYSLKLDKKNRKQQLRVELLTPVGSTEAGSQMYRSSGWQVGPVGSSLVVEQIDMLSLAHLPGLTREQRMHDALLPVEKVLTLRKKGYSQVANDLEGIIAAIKATRSGSQLQLTRQEGWSAHHRCYWCKTSWYDATTGKLFKCSQCFRSYHQHHAQPPILNSQDPSAWVCGVCSQEDPDVCVHCAEPFTEKEVEDPASLENNELVHCQGCNSWWHQACHMPCLYPLPIGDWHCHKCSEEASLRPRGGVAAAAAAASSRRRGQKRRQASNGPSSTTGPAAGVSAADAAWNAAVEGGIVVGALVMACFQGGKRRYPGVVTAVADGFVDVDYDDDSDFESDIPIELVELNKEAIRAAAVAPADGPGVGSAAAPSSSRRQRAGTAYGHGTSSENRGAPTGRELLGADAVVTRNSALTWNDHRT